jgi:hypothetical protein
MDTTLNEMREATRWHSPRARFVLIITVVTAAWFVSLTFSPWKQGFAEKPRFAHIKHNDSDLYHAEVDWIRGGAGYYEAAGRELARRGYPTASLFNWRTPLPMWLIGKLPSKVWGRTLLAGMALVLLLAGVDLAAREFGAVGGLAAGWLLSGALMYCCLGESYVMPILWASVLIGLSLCAYGRGSRIWGVALGVAAVYFRDLAGPYGVFCLTLAAHRRNWKECLAWIVGLGTYGLFFFGPHAHWVAAHMRANSIAHEEGWLRLGGAPFLLSLTQVNGYLIIWPQWISAIYLAVALLGLAQWNTPLGRRFAAVTVGYLVLFSFVGQDFNQYWGALLAVPLAISAAKGAVAIPSLVRQAVGRPAIANLLVPS